MSFAVSISKLATADLIFSLASVRFVLIVPTVMQCNKEE